MNRIIILLSLVLIFAACGNQKNDKQTTQNQSKKTVAIEPDAVTNIILNDSMQKVIAAKGKIIVRKTGTRLKAELQSAIRAGGLEHAVSFCNTRAMEITDSISEAEQVKVRRLAKKFRNPVNETDENESEIYKNYVISIITNKPVYPSIGITEEGNPVLYHPIMVEDACLNCHGTPGKEVQPAVAEKIAELYPNDYAMNFERGHPRGMWAITFPEYKVVAAE